MSAPESVFKIAHISDLHCGGPYFMPSLMERAIGEVNDLEPDLVICTGDLTTFGFKQEFIQAKAYLDRIQCESFVVVPGNHDSRNVGYVHFEELFGERNSVLSKNGVTVVAVDSTEPDLDHGQVGRSQYRWIEEQFVEAANLRIFVLHHHLLPVPGTGRERNVVYDAGDLIECLQRGRRRPRPLGAQARAVRLEARGSVRRQHRDRLLAPPTREDEALLQRDRGLRHARGRLAQVPVPRPGEDHPVLDGDARVREVHGAHRGRGDDAVVTRALAIIDGEHYAPVVQDALASLPYDFGGAWLVGGTEKLRGDDEYGVLLFDDLERALADLEPEVVVDLSDEPVLGPRERFRVASRVLAHGVPYVGPDFRFDPPELQPFDLPSIGIVGTGKRVGKTAVAGHALRLFAQDRDVRRRRDGPRRASRARGRRGRPHGRAPARAVS